MWDFRVLGFHQEWAVNWGEEQWNLVSLTKKQQPHLMLPDALVRTLELGEG